MAGWFMLVVYALLVSYWIGAIVFIVLENRPPAVALAWLLVLILLPYIGLPLYVFFGRNWSASVKTTGWYRDLEVLVPQALDPFYARFESASAEVREGNRSVPAVARILRSIERMDGAHPLPVRTLDIFDTGAAHFEQLKHDMSEARHFIHLSTYIWERDPLTAEICEILEDRLSHGVEVRINYDWFGSVRYRKDELRRLKRAGAKVAADFMELTKINYRNHRKIVVIDREIGYTGGMNVGQEYIDGGARFASWRDTQIRMTGPGVAQLQSWFATRWYADTREILFKDRYLPDLNAPCGSTYVQTVATGPDNTWGSARRAHLEAIGGACEQVLVQSPYFVPDESTNDALIDAALAGLDVRLMMTGVADKKLPFWAARSYWLPFVKAGGKLYLYEDGFFHPKTIAIDGKVCAVGTMNMDVRSFRLDQELMVWIYDRAAAARIQAQFMRDIGACHEITVDEASDPSVPQRFLSSGARLISNLL